MVDDKETIKLDELDEDEYDALSEEKKEELEKFGARQEKRKNQTVSGSIQFVSFFW